MSDYDKEELRYARRRFAAEYHAVLQECGVVEGETEPKRIVAVTDSGCDPLAHVYGIDTTKPLIVVTWIPAKDPGDPKKWLTFPRRHEGYDVHYVREISAGGAH